MTTSDDDDDSYFTGFGATTVTLHQSKQRLITFGVRICSILSTLSNTYDNTLKNMRYKNFQCKQITIFYTRRFQYSLQTTSGTDGLFDYFIKILNAANFGLFVGIMSNFYHIVSP